MRVIWIVAGVFLLAWTLVVATAAGLLGSLADTLMAATGYVPGFTLEAFTLPWLADLGRGVGLVVLTFAWAAGAAVMLAGVGIAALIRRLLGTRTGRIAPAR